MSLQTGLILVGVMVGACYLALKIIDFIAGGQESRKVPSPTGDLLAPTDRQLKHTKKVHPSDGKPSQED